MDQVHGVRYDAQIWEILQYCLLSVWHFLSDYIITLLPSLESTVRPCQPRSSDIGIDYICMEWKKLKKVEKDTVSHYEIKMKVADDKLWPKTVVPTEDRQPLHRFDELLQNTGYEFMVRAVYIGGRTSDFSCKSAVIKTECSAMCTILKVCQKTHNGPPSVYRLPVVEIRSSTDNDQKTQKCRIGNSTCLREKTILMVGLGEAGKSTLINGLVNHSMGVRWEHDWRFKITDEPEITPPNQESHTEWITNYKVHPIMADYDLILNMIDTPSFHEGPGSTERNQKLIQRLKGFLFTRGPKGMNGIDAVCFVSRANADEFSDIDKALREIFVGIVSIFGVNILGNIIPMLTFADGKEPSVLPTLSTVGVPTTRYFVFNSSTLFPPYSNDALLGKALWQFRCRGFEKFLKHLSNMKPCRALKNSSITATLSRKPIGQQEIMTYLQGNRLEINGQLMDLATVQADRDIVKKFAVDIELNNPFSYNEDVYSQEKIPLEPGTHVTNCIVCHTTCHYPCLIQDTNDKKRCSAMNDGICTQCHQKCVWHMHRNDTFRTEEKVETVKRTNAGLKAKYEFDVEESVSSDAMLLAIKRAFVSLVEEVTALISKTVESSNSLQGIHQSEQDFIKLMIATEEQGKKYGHEKRLELLRAIHNNTTVSIGDPNTWLQEMGFGDW